MAFHLQALCRAGCKAALWVRNCWQVQYVLAARWPWGCPQLFQLSLGIPHAPAARGEVVKPELLLVAVLGLMVCPVFPTALQPQLHKHAD